jgi:hypothetical protein
MDGGVLTMELKGEGAFNLKDFHMASRVIRVSL